MNLFKIIFHVKFSIKNMLINKQKLILTMFVFSSSYTFHLLYDKEITFSDFTSPHKHFVLYPFMVKNTLDGVHYENKHYEW